MSALIKVLRKSDQAIVVNQGSRANTFLTRLVGWIGKTRTQTGDGLLLEQCNNIHTWMMFVPIDAVFLRDGTIVKTATNLKPWKLLPVVCMEAKDTLELPAGTVDRLNLKPGEVLCIDS